MVQHQRPLVFIKLLVESQTLVQHVGDIPDRLVDQRALQRLGKFCDCVDLGENGLKQPVVEHGIILRSVADKPRNPIGQIGLHRDHRLHLVKHGSLRTL